MKFYQKIITFVLMTAFSMAAVAAQDKQELEAEKAAGARLKGEHPIERLMREHPVNLRPDLKGVHPRVYLNQSQIDALKQKTLDQKELWEAALARVRALSVEPPAPPAEERRVQNEVGLGIAEAALIFKITGEKKYLDAAKKYMDAAVSYDIWGYSYNKPNVDLAAGHLLYGMGWAYDLLYHDLTAAERTKYREKLVKQARLLYDFFKPKKGKTYAYSQNHTFIPISGLAVTAYALMDEIPEAQKWADLSRAIFDRVLATYTQDGYFYESMEYWIFSTPWLVHYMDAHHASTGEDLYQTTPGFRLAHKYVSHITLPGGEFNFDFGDIYAGNVTRSRKGNDYERERIDGRFRTNYNILFNLAGRYNSGEAQGVANWLRSKGQVNAEEIWTFIWYRPEIKAISIEQQPTSHYFEDHGVVFWRNNWADDATAFAFKAGPPEGHSVTEKVEQFPDWRLSSGHAHPDAGSFIIWANGKYLTGDSGYAGLPLTEHHNTLVFDGIGQNREGKGHDVFTGIPYSQLNKIRLTNVLLEKDRVAVTADIAAAYEPEVGVKKLVRSFEFIAPGSFIVKDRIATDIPRTVTSFLHADNSIIGDGPGRFIFEPPAPSLFVTIAKPDLFKMEVEKNILTTPGRPGSVDKGEREERGVRLNISTKAKTRTQDLEIKLEIKK